MESKSGCLICGGELVYQPDYVTMECVYCKGTFQSNVSCLEHHFICDLCHAGSGEDLIMNYCLQSRSQDPVEMATELMQNEKIKMHGPEHHFLVPAVLITAYCNAVNDESKAVKLATARKRADKIPGGFCGTHGNCGAGVGAGIFVSVITKSTSLSKEEWSLSNLITGKSLVSIACHGGPRCCKRDVYLTLEESVRFLKENFNIMLPAGEIHCQFSDHNKECLKTSCLYYPQN